MEHSTRRKRIEIDLLGDWKPTAEEAHGCCGLGRFLVKGGNDRLIIAGALPATSRFFSSLSRSSSFARTGEFFFFVLLSFSVLLEEEESSSSRRRSSSLASLAART